MEVRMRRLGIAFDGLLWASGFGVGTIEISTG